MPAVNLVVAILVLLGLITILKIHPFVSLLFAAFWVGIFAGMPLVQIAQSVQTGFGNTLGFIGIVLGFGTVIGKLLEESGGAQRIARTLIGIFGPQRVHWAMYLVAFIVGIPVFFQVGFVLLVPLVFTLAKELKIPTLKIGIPTFASLACVHGILPPHPGALAAVGILKADMGMTILYGIIVGLPAAMLAGPLFATLGGMRLPGVSDVRVDTATEEIETAETPTSMPGFFITLFTILLPVLLLLFSTYADIFMQPTDPLFGLFKFIGAPSVALFVAVLVAFYTFGIARGISLARIQSHADASFLVIASILLIVGAGGAFGRVLVDSGIGAWLGTYAQGFQTNPLVLGWLLSSLFRAAMGSSTVAMTTAAGIVAPLTAQTGTSPELMAVVLGGGALMFSHVNDSGFWVVKEYFRMSLKVTFLTWSLSLTILGTAALLFALLLQGVAR